MYTTAVAEAAIALKTGEDANWTLARLTFENTLSRGGTEQPGKVSMEKWCADVRTESARQGAGRKFSQRTGRAYKEVWTKYGRHHDGDRPAWVDVWNELRPEEKPAPPTEEQYARTVEAEVFNAPMEKKIEAVQRLLSESEVVEAVMNDRPTRLMVQKAINDEYVRQEREIERKSNADPVSKKLAQETGVLDLDKAIDECTFKIRKILPEIGELSNTNRTIINDTLKRHGVEIDRVHHLVQYGKSDLDTFIGSVLSASNE